MSTWKGKGVGKPQALWKLETGVEGEEPLEIQTATQSQAVDKVHTNLALPLSEIAEDFRTGWYEPYQQHMYHLAGSMTDNEENKRCKP